VEEPQKGQEGGLLRPAQVEQRKQEQGPAVLSTEILNPVRVTISWVVLDSQIKPRKKKKSTLNKVRTGWKRKSTEVEQ
jgi:hypothetical protein